VIGGLFRGRDGTLSRHHSGSGITNLFRSITMTNLLLLLLLGDTGKLRLCERNGMLRVEGLTTYATYLLLASSLELVKIGGDFRFLRVRIEWMYSTCVQITCRSVMYLIAHLIAL
jgi:hypothetical protein